MTIEYNFRLVAEPENTRVLKTDYKRVRDILTYFVKENSASEYYCFWGYYGDGVSSVSEADKDKYVKGSDNLYYEKETMFHTVPGYEKVSFKEAKDKSLYHPGGDNPAPGNSKTEEGDDTSTKEKLTTIYTDTEGNKVEKKWVPEGSEPAPSPSNTFTFTAIEGETFFVYCGYSDTYNYVFAFQEIDGGVECPWTYEKRFNVFKAEYSSDYVTSPNDYTLYAVSDEVNGVFPGTPMKDN